MFPSAHCDNPFESLIKKSSSFPPDQNPISKQDDPPCLFNFPSPFFDEHESPLNQIFFQNQLMAANPCSSDHHTDHGNTDPTKRDATKRNILAASKLDEKEGNQPISAPLRRRNLGVIPRRRAGKKDRHSKICTAQGIRDRRMRLSLQVARKFFDLQDMLGYDKASKTIEWLFTKSKKAIKELINEHAQANNISTSEIDAKSESSLSESEEMSEIEENSNKDVKQISTTVPAANVMPSCISPSENDEMRKSPKSASKPNARESREKARARARCRTREKMMVKRLECSAQWYKPNPTDNDNSQKLGSANSPFEGVDQESNSNNNQEKISPYEAAYNSFEQQLADVGTIEKFLGNSSCSSSTSACHISDYHCSAGVSGFTDPSSNFMGFLGNWDLLSNIERANSIHYSVTNQVSLEGNPNSVYSVTTDFP